MRGSKREGAMPNAIRISWMIVLLAAVVAVEARAAAPPNDDCAAAIPVGDGIYAGTTLDATPDGADACNGSGGGDVWYLFTAPLIARIRIRTEASMERCIRS